jgi:hypothetical protein
VKPPITQSSPSMTTPFASKRATGQGAAVLHMSSVGGGRVSAGAPPSADSDAQATPKSAQSHANRSRPGIFSIAWAPKPRR